MFNVTVLKIKDIVKYLLGTIILIGIIVYTTRFFAYKPNEQKIEKKQEKVSITEILKIRSNTLKKCLNKTIPVMAELEKEKESKKTTNNENKIFESFLETEISSIKGMEETEKEKNQTEDSNGSDNKKNTSDENKSDSNNSITEDEKIILASNSGIKTEVVTPNPIAENANVQYGNVKIKNQTTYNLTEDILNPNIKIDNKNILIFHTHSCESYTPSEKYQYSQTGNYRTTDKNYSVIRVGNELENYLKQYNINVIHDTSYHDYPSYTGSYTRSLQTVENILKTNQSDIIIDLHRDAVGSRPDYAPTVKIGEDYAAQIMFVIGTNEGGLWHPNWQQNLKFAVKVQQKAEEMYPGLFKPIMLTKSRYNQHTGKYANIMEIGSTGNTLDQCLNSMKYLSAVLNEILK
ncbi:MAG: stage II sporulation protein P [Clostridia bacterium]